MNMPQEILIFGVVLLLLLAIRSGITRAYRSRKTSSLFGIVMFLGIGYLIIYHSILGGIVALIVGLIFVIGWLESDKYEEEEEDTL